MLMRASDPFVRLRQQEFARLDLTGSTYLDYTGAALYPASLIRRDARRLSSGVLGNPHSESAPSLASTGAMEEARARTLRFFDASPSEYDLVFTANATAAIRILAEAFPFRRSSRLVMSADNHNSVNGLRVAARRRQSAVDYVPLDGALRSVDPMPFLPPATAPSLFAFPAQSNFSGVRHPLGWVREAQQRGYRILLDAASYVPTSALSLTQVPVDFLAISYYKMFGYPTGVGALIARREALSRLRRNYFGGGTVAFSSVQNRLARPRAGAAGFEDGTPNFLAMPAVTDGLQWLEGVGRDRTAAHVEHLTEQLIDRLIALPDRVVLYGPRTTADRGGTVAFNLMQGNRLLPYEQVESAACEEGIAIRGGCFCNPGAAEQALAIPAAKARACLRGRFTVPRFRECLDGLPVGALRASIGIPTSQSDIDHLIGFIREITN